MNPKYAPLFQTYTLNNGVTIKNRLVVAPMTHFGSQADGLISDQERTFLSNRAGDMGLFITAATLVQKDGKAFHGQPEATGEHCLDSLKETAQILQQQGAKAILQIHHGGSKAIDDLLDSLDKISASASEAEHAREATEKEVEALIASYAQAADLALRAGFDGVEIHGANGYLIQQFYSAQSNRRNDQWGGSLENRMRFLLKTYTAIRAAVGKDFLVGVKLNSADFQKGGFDESESVQMVQKLSEMGIDFIEVSGGNYESPQMLAAKDSTRKREAFFIDYAEKARAVSQVPLIITGGFRSQNAMEDALSSGHLDLVGVARPFALVPDLANQMQNGTYQTVQTDRIQTGVAFVDKKAGAMLEMNWYMTQMDLIGQGKQPDPKLSAWKVLLKTLWENGKAGLSTGRA
ncbi:MAG: NADH oxidase [Neisseria sp.]|nr:NADH oxidase [Neisseria sp.]